MVVGTLYQPAIILNHFEGLNLSLSALKISDLEQLNNEIFALLSTRFYCLKIDYLIKRIGITECYKYLFRWIIKQKVQIGRCDVQRHNNILIKLDRFCRPNAFVNTF